MSETSSTEMDTIIERIAGIIAEDVDSLYALDFEKGIYRGIKCSALFQTIFGTEGNLGRFMTRLLTGRAPAHEVDPYTRFYSEPDLTGKVFGKQIVLENGSESRSLYFMYFREDSRTAYAFFYPWSDSLLLEDKESYKEEALKKHLFSMIVDLDADECSDFYISEFSQPSPAQRNLKTSYSGWRKSLSDCIVNEHLQSFLDNTAPMLVRKKLMMFSRHSYIVQMHNLSGRVLWTLHTMLRVRDASEEHLLFVYTVQDIDADISSFLPKNSGRPADGSIDSSAHSPSEINSVLSKTLQSLAPFSEIILEHVESEIRNNYKDKISLKQLAGKYYINTAYLGQLFIQKYGVTFHDFLSKVRMENAAHLLTSTSNSISQVAEMCGVPNTNYFHRQFRKYFGCTPNEYKSRHSE